MKIIVFGSNGMLGRYVYSYFKSQDFDVVGLTRKDLDLTIANITNVSWLLQSKDITNEDVVINCAGMIKQRDKAKNSDFVVVNTMFPHILARVCDHYKCHLIHVTTDCVFDGSKGFYTEQAKHDALDLYGMTKSIGEPSDVTIIRTSIIGEELNNFSSLLEWVKANNGKTINGYINHIWNGITCLQFAKTCKDIIINNSYWKGVQHVFSPGPVVNKFELVNMISNVYDLDITIMPFKTEEKCDRSLLTIYNILVFKSLLDQLIEMKEFRNKLEVM